MARSGGSSTPSLVAGTLQFCAWWLPRLLSPIVVIAPLMLAFPGLWPRTAAVLAAWAACFVAFYAPYRWTHEQWWFLRFLLPAAPALIVAGLLVARHLLERASGRWPDAARRLLPALVLAVSAGVELAQTSPLREARAVGHGELKYGRVSRWLKANVPGNAAIVVSQASGALYYFTDFTLLRHDQMDAAVSARGPRVASGRGQAPVCRPFPVRGRRAEAAAGNLDPRRVGKRRRRLAAGSVRARRVACPRGPRLLGA